MLQSRVKYYSIYRMQELLERNFCEGLEMQLAMPLVGILQDGAPETAVESVTPCFFRLV